MARVGGISFMVIGAAIALSGASVVARAIETGPLVRIGNDARNGDPRPPAAALPAAIAGLEALSQRSGDEAGALTFLHYALAEDAIGRGDAAAARQDAARAEAGARETLRLAPARADVALALAELRYRRGADRAAIEAPLRLSYSTAPRELWIIERRIDLGLRMAPLIATEGAWSDLLGDIKRDIRTLGEPGHDPVYYLEIARAAYASGFYAMALARQELAAVSPQSLQVFNQDIEALGAAKPR